jgi:DNA-nicking Smr family endonuclease
LRAAGAALLGWLTPRRAQRDPAPEPEEEDEPFFDENEPVEIPITDSIDLHYFPPGDVGEIVDAYLEAAAERGLREVRIIHGRGRGVQRNRVRRHLERSVHVQSFADAPADRGGWGATVVALAISARGEPER